jgi:hypothetical protein
VSAVGIVLWPERSEMELGTVHVPMHMAASRMQLACRLALVFFSYILKHNHTNAAAPRACFSA